ncbi:hypothetical protein GGF31_000773 [Allomyces arbusculus]|nr:hypothetical protein GGF31_000773 [Allomyces arbusculus]
MSLSAIPRRYPNPQRSKRTARSPVGTPLAPTRAPSSYLPGSAPYVDYDDDDADEYHAPVESPVSRALRSATSLLQDQLAHALRTYLTYCNNVIERWTRGRPHLAPYYRRFALAAALPLALFCLYALVTLLFALSVAMLGVVGVQLVSMLVGIVALSGVLAALGAALVIMFVWSRLRLGHRVNRVMDSVVDTFVAGGPLDPATRRARRVKESRTHSGQTRGRGLPRNAAAAAVPVMPTRPLPVLEHASAPLAATAPPSYLGPLHYIPAHHFPNHDEDDDDVPVADVDDEQQQPLQQPESTPRAQSRGRLAALGGFPGTHIGDENDFLEHVAAADAAARSVLSRRPPPPPVFSDSDNEHDDGGHTPPSPATMLRQPPPPAAEYADVDPDEDVLDREFRVNPNSHRASLPPVSASHRGSMLRHEVEPDHEEVAKEPEWVEEAYPEGEWEEHVYGGGGMKPVNGGSKRASLLSQLSSLLTPAADGDAGERNTAKQERRASKRANAWRASMAELDQELAEDLARVGAADAAVPRVTGSARSSRPSSTRSSSVLNLASATAAAQELAEMVEDK